MGKKYKVEFEDLFDIDIIARGREPDIHSILRRKNMEISELLAVSEQDPFDDIFYRINRVFYRDEEDEDYVSGAPFPKDFTPVDFYCHLLDLEIEKKKHPDEGIRSLNSKLWREKYGMDFSYDYGDSGIYSSDSDDIPSEVVPHYLKPESGFRIIHPDDLRKRQNMEEDGSIDGGNPERQFKEVAKNGLEVSVAHHELSYGAARHRRRDTPEMIYDDQKYHPPS